MKKNDEENLDYLRMMCRELKDSIERSRISGKVPRTVIEARESRYRTLIVIGSDYKALAEDAA